MDQYLAIVFALRYDNLITHLRTWCLILVSWLFSIVIGTLSAFKYKINSNNLWSSHVNAPVSNNLNVSANLSIDEKLLEMKEEAAPLIKIDPATNGTSKRNPSADLESCIHPECEQDKLFSQYKSDVFAMSDFVLVFLIPSILLTICYVRIYLEAHNNSKVSR